MVRRFRENLRASMRKFSFSFFLALHCCRGVGVFKVAAYVSVSLAMYLVLSENSQVPDGFSEIFMYQRSMAVII
jgi:hypothetical protein